MRFKTAFLYTACVCIVFSVAMPQLVFAGPGRQLAVVVGVNTYRANTGLNPLQHAVHDASRLSAVLRKSGFKVIEMTHDVAREPGKEVFAPNLDYIRDQITGLLETPNLGANDSILITLHGHGVHFDWIEKVGRNKKKMELKSPKFYFCPADASILGIESAQDVQEKHHLLPLDEIYASLGRCPATTKLLIVDACRNDPTASVVFRDGEVKSKTMPKLAPPPGGMAAFLSCRENQRAVEDKELGQGVFTHFLVQGLEGKADLQLEGKPADGIVTLAELTTYTANNTYAYVFEKHNGLKQSPEIKGEFDANLPLVRLKSTSPDLLVAPFDAARARAGQQAWAKHLKLPGTFSNSSGVELELIPPGEYLRGSSPADVQALKKADPMLSIELLKHEQPQHRVRISVPFYIAKNETTDVQFLKVLARNVASTGASGGRRRKVGGLNPEQLSAERVTWFDCLEFCNKLSELEGRSPCYELSDIEWTVDRVIKGATVRVLDGTGYRLPTDAEWEYACRAGTTTPFASGEKLDLKQSPASRNTAVPKVSAKQPDSADPSSVPLSPAQSNEPNQFGLHEMCGNLWEWCHDGYNETTYQTFAGKLATDPIVEPAGKFRILRGGAGIAESGHSRPAIRLNRTPGSRVDYFGFRVVLPCGPKAAPGVEAVTTP